MMKEKAEVYNFLFFFFTSLFPITNTEVFFTVQFRILALLLKTLSANIFIIIVFEETLKEIMYIFYRSAE
jgi:hypothetical protein